MLWQGAPSQSRHAPCSPRVRTASQTASFQGHSRVVVGAGVEPGGEEAEFPPSGTPPPPAGLAPRRGGYKGGR